MERLKHLLRPAAGGIYTVSTGRRAQLEVQKRVYGADSEEKIVDRWHDALNRLRSAKAVILGVPSDVGAGFARGASFGPQAIRSALIRRGSWLLDDDRIVDAGDVRVVPQLLHDEMLSPAQIERTRTALYEDATRSDLPVSPLSIAHDALATIRNLAPDSVLITLGGDHSVGWPAALAVAQGREHKMGILHFDAHTDLLETRLGVKYCFATWAYHANELIGRNQRLQQVGLRISGKTKEHWEQSLDVRQYWMDEVSQRSANEIADEIIDAFERAGVQGVYISNDIDGTDPKYASATGTPEPGGLDPDTVVALIEQVGGAFEVWGSDLVEVAPTLGATGAEPNQTLDTSSRYLEAQVATALLR